VELPREGGRTHLGETGLGGKVLAHRLEKTIWPPRGKIKGKGSYTASEGGVGKMLSLALAEVGAYRLLRGEGRGKKDKRCIIQGEGKQCGGLGK